MAERMFVPGSSFGVSPTMVPMPTRPVDLLNRYIDSSQAKMALELSRHPQQQNEPLTNGFQRPTLPVTSNNVVLEEINSAESDDSSKKTKRKIEKTVDSEQVGCSNNNISQSINFSAQESNFINSLSPVSMSSFVQLCSSQFTQESNSSQEQSNPSMENVGENKKIFKCSVCAKEYTSKYFFSLHMKSHEGGNIHECSFCSYVTKSESQLKLHTRYIHELGAVEIPKQETNTRGSNGEFLYPALAQNHAVIKAQQSELRPFKCSLCQSNFRRKQDLTRHERSHQLSDHKCSKCGLIFSSDVKLKEHEVLHNVKEVFCHRCGMKFPHPFHLQMHQATCVLENPISLNPNGQPVIGSTGNLNVGSVMTEMFSMTVPSTQASTKSSAAGSSNVVKPNMCEVCGKSFSTNFYLRTHRRSHTGEKPYHCKECGKSFTQASVLKTHSRIHTGEKPYSCETCGKAFSVRLYLQSHIRTHTGERPYECTTCGRCFSQKSALLTHRKKRH